MAAQGEATGERTRLSRVPSVRDIDLIYRETDRLYYEFARDCGLSTSAFWSLVSIVVRNGSATQAVIANEYSYSRQTVNSAIKSLESKGLVQSAREEGNRRSKTLRLTEAGEVFCDQHVRPAVDAERRAFESLSVEQRQEFVHLVRTYSDAIDNELRKLGAGKVSLNEGAMLSEDSTAHEGDTAREDAAAHQGDTAREADTSQGGA